MAAVAVHLVPFRIVLPGDGGEWNIDLEQINSRSYDHNELQKIACFLPSGFSPKLGVPVSIDGTLGAPLFAHIGSTSGFIDEYNRLLGRLLLGGVYCEAVSGDDVAQAAIINRQYVWMRNCGRSAASHLHYSIRTKYAGALQVIELHKPEVVSENELLRAESIGHAVLQQLPNVKPEFILRGVSSAVRLEWAQALIELWTVVEQLVEEMWKRHIIQAGRSPACKITGRKEQLEDYRTWTLATRLELLYQQQFLTDGELQVLTTARRARNKLVHDGLSPDREVVHSLLEINLQLLAQESKAVDKIPLEVSRLVRYERPEMLRQSTWYPEAPKGDAALWLPLPAPPASPGGKSLEKEE